MNWDLTLEIAGFAIGVLYLWWEYHANARMWLVGIIMPAISMWIYFRKGLYADFSMNIYYFIMAIYGYWAWTRRSRGSKVKEKPQLDIHHAAPLTLLGCAGTTVMLWAAIGYMLTFTNSTVVVYDAFTTALSIVATWMLARKIIEQWWCWVLVDAVCVGLYIYKGIYFYATLYAIYTVIAFFGYFKWRRMMLATTQQ